MPPGQRWEEEFFKTFSSSFTIPEYKDWPMAILEVLSVQKERGWNPSNPRTGISYFIFSRVKKIINRRNRDEDTLRLYCAIGTSLDYHHGVDGFFEYNGSLATFDLTVNPQKRRSQGKAQIIIRRTRRIYAPNHLNGIAHEVFATLMTRRVKIYEAD